MIRPVFHYVKYRQCKQIKMCIMEMSQFTCSAKQNLLYNSKIQASLLYMFLLNHKEFGYMQHHIRKEHQHTSQQEHTLYTPTQ